MNLKRLYEILGETTVQLRKGDVVRHERHTNLDVITIDAMPHESEARPDIEKIDMEMLVIGVDRAKAQQHRDELVSILREYPEPERLANGPSYIEVGAVIGDQGAAFQLFALGQVLDFWQVITPTKLGLTGETAMEAAGRGFIMISGFRQ